MAMGGLFLRTLYYTKAEKSILKFLLEIYELGVGVKVFKNDKEYVINSYFISKALLAKSVGLHIDTITRAINSLSDKNIIKYKLIIINNSVQGSIIYFNSDLYLHPEFMNELSDILDNLNIINDALSYKKIKGSDINSVLLSKHKELNSEDIKSTEDIVEPIKEELKRDRADITILYKMFLKQNKAIMKSLDLIAEQNKAVIKSLDLLSEAIGKIGSVGTINKAMDKSILNNPIIDNDSDFTMVNTDTEKNNEFSIDNIEDTESVDNIKNGLIVISEQTQVINGKDVITIEPNHSIMDTGPDIDAYLYENDEEYAKEVAGIKDRDDMTYEDLDYFRYLKNITDNFYHRFYDKPPKYRYTYGLQYLSDLICYRFSIDTEHSELCEFYSYIDKEGFITYYLCNHDSYVNRVIADLPIKPESVDIGELGLILNYSENIPPIIEPYSYKLKFDFCYKNFYLGNQTNDKSDVTLLSYELLPIAISIYDEAANSLDKEFRNHLYDIDYSKKHILFKLFYISLKRSQTKKYGEFMLGRNSFYEGKDDKLIMHKTTWLIINKVDYQPFVKQLLIDYTEWICGGGNEWKEEIEKYIIPKKRISTRRVYNGFKNGLPNYDIEYIESELLDGHIIRRIYEKMMDGHFKKGYCLGLDEAGLGKAVKKDIPAYKTNTKEYQDLFYRFIGLRKTAFGYVSMKGIIPIAKNDFEFYERLVEERLAVLITNHIYFSMTREEYNEKDKSERRKIWSRLIQNFHREVDFDWVMRSENYLDEEDGLSELEKEYIKGYPNIVLSIIHDTQGNYYSFNTLKKHIREKLDLLRKELKKNKTESKIEDNRLGLKSEMDIKKIAEGLNEIQRNYI